jgi:hypothetical protein
MDHLLQAICENPWDTLLFCAALVFLAKMAWESAS